MTKSKACAALLAALSLGVAATGGAALAAEKSEKAKDAQESREALRAKLDEAQRRLDQAAREVAELSMSLSGDVIAHAAPFVRMTKRAVLGIGLAPRGQERDDGVEIATVSPGGGAAEAGLKSGDVIVEMNGKPLAREGDRSPHEKLLAMMRDIEPDETVHLRYRRDGKLHDAKVVAKSAMNHHVFAFRTPEAGAIGIPAPPPPIAFRRADGVFGSAELVSLTPKLGRYFGTDKGLLVVRAPNDSRLELQEGDVILDIDGRVPSSPSHALRILGSYQGGEKLKLNVMRDKKRVTFEITIPQDAKAGGPFEGRLLTPGRPLLVPNEEDVRIELPRQEQERRIIRTEEGQRTAV